jgi:site-specific recombinase XerD
VLVRAKRPKKLPVVLTRDEVQCLLAATDGEDWLFMHLLYGTGIRIMGCATLRIKDIGFRARLITIRVGKGGSDLVSMVPRHGHRQERGQPAWRVSVRFG